VTDEVTLPERLALLADDWEQASADYYYQHRYITPMAYAQGYEDGWDHAGDLLRRLAARLADGGEW
jgi:hypothetical protein